MAHDPNERIRIVHPSVSVAAICTRHQLDEVWAERGWTEAGEKSKKGIASDPDFHREERERAKRAANAPVVDPGPKTEG